MRVWEQQSRQLQVAWELFRVKTKVEEEEAAAAVVCQQGRQTRNEQKNKIVIVKL